MNRDPAVAALENHHAMKYGDPTNGCESDDQRPRGGDDIVMVQQFFH